MNVKAMALAGEKIKPTTFDQWSWADVKKEFATQVENNLDCPGQRNQIAQVRDGWKHIKDSVSSSQGTLQVVTYEGRAKRFMPKFVLVDGFHRVYYWMSLEDDKVTDGCPFTDLNIELHTVKADTEEEAKLKTDAIARTFNSKASVKKGGDFLTAAVRQAGLKAKSNGYQTGRGSGVAEFLKRVVGPSDKPTPLLTAEAATALKCHAAIDELMSVIEESPKLRALRSRIFNAGVMDALFCRFQRLSDAELTVGKGQVISALMAVGKPAALASLSLDSVVLSLVNTFNELADINFRATVLAQGNRVSQYNFLHNLLKDKFVIVGTEPEDPVETKPATSAV